MSRGSRTSLALIGRRPPGRDRTYTFAVSPTLVTPINRPDQWAICWCLLKQIARGGSMKQEIVCQRDR